MLTFPKDFVWETATASYQIEGGVNEDGKGLSIWDTFSHTPGKIFNNENGDIACDHYHKYKDDIKLMAELNLNSYRFSIAWSRIFPEGKGKINQKDVGFYNRIIDELLKKGIDPAITLYHWDLPQKIQDIDGWENRDTVDYFIEYSNCVFEKYGDRVKTWITHNESWVASYAGNFEGRHAPGLKRACRQLFRFHII